MSNATVLEYVNATGGQVQPALRADSNDIPTALRLGLTVRDYFAGQALAGMLANDSGQTPEDDAVAAYAVADAMIAERRLLLVPPARSPHEQAESGK